MIQASCRERLVETMPRNGAHMRGNCGQDVNLRWEDSTFRDLSQDYAHMHVWEKMVVKVDKFYHKLPPEEKAKYMIEGGHCGEAGGLSFYRKK